MYSIPEWFGSDVRPLIRDVLIYIKPEQHVDWIYKSIGLS